jgi:hypothetical protein
MFTKLMLVSVLISGTAFASPVQDSVYVGPGQCTENGKTRSYIGKAEFKGDSYTSTFDFGGHTHSYQLKFKCNPDGTFEVYHNGQKVGEGFCQGKNCHYKAKINGFEIEETLELIGDQLHRTGRCSCPSGSETWEDTLDLDSTPKFSFYNSTGVLI